MNYSSIDVQITEHIAHVLLNRPKVFNALNQSIADELYDAFNKLDKDPQIRVIILSGSGKGFCAGGDVSFLQFFSEQSETGLRKILIELFERLSIVRRLETPVIGAVHGVALGAGFSLALLCDVRIAAQDTKFGAEYAYMGIIPEIGCTHTLPNMVGTAKAMEIVLTGRKFDANEAERIGLVNKVVPNDKLLDEAMAWAKKIAALPPIAVSITKSAMYKGAVSSFEESVQSESNLNALCYQTEDHKEAATAFLEKRKPSFKGR